MNYTLQKRQFAIFTACYHTNRAMTSNDNTKLFHTYHPKQEGKSFCFSNISFQEILIENHRLIMLLKLFIIPRQCMTHATMNIIYGNQYSEQILQYVSYYFEIVSGQLLINHCVIKYTSLHIVLLTSLTMLIILSLRTVRCQRPCQVCIYLTYCKIVFYFIFS